MIEFEIYDLLMMGIGVGIVSYASHFCHRTNVSYEFLEDIKIHTGIEPGQINPVGANEAEHVYKRQHISAKRFFNEKRIIGLIKGWGLPEYILPDKLI